MGKAKDDGRLPMDDHNTRIVGYGADGATARALAEKIAKNAFHNVVFFAGAYEVLLDVVFFTGAHEELLVVSAP